MNYIENNLRLINGANQLSKMFDKVYGLTDIYSTICKMALDNIKYEDNGGSLLVVKLDADEVFSLSPQRYHSTFSANDTENGIRMLMLAGILNSPDPSYMVIEDLAYYNQLPMDRINNNFSIKQKLTYMAVASMYGYNTAVAVFSGLTEGSLGEPNGNQPVILECEVMNAGVSLVENSIRVLVPSTVPFGKRPPVNAEYSLEQLDALKMVGWLDSKGIGYGPASEINSKYIPDDILATDVVLYDKALAK